MKQQKHGPSVPKSPAPRRAGESALLELARGAAPVTPPAPGAPSPAENTTDVTSNGETSGGGGGGSGGHGKHDARAAAAAGGAPGDAAEHAAARRDWHTLLERSTASTGPRQQSGESHLNTTNSPGDSGGGGGGGGDDALVAAPQLLAWEQDTTSVHVRVAVPAGTRAREVAVDVRADFLGVSLAGHGPITGAHGGAPETPVRETETLSRVQRGTRVSPWPLRGDPRADARGPSGPCHPSYIFVSPPCSVRVNLSYVTPVRSRFLLNCQPGLTSRYIPEIAGRLAPIPATTPRRCSSYR